MLAVLKLRTPVIQCRCNRLATSIKILDGCFEAPFDVFFTWTLPILRITEVSEGENTDSRGSPSNH